MKKMQKIFIAREYMLIDDYGGVRIDEEEIFLTFKDARNYLKTLEDKNAGGNDFLLFRTEILEFIIGQLKSHSRKWIFNLRGELIEVSPPIESDRKEPLPKFIKKYKVGDIVFILPKIQNKFSPSVRGVYGVIAETPLVNLNKDADFKDKKKLDREYVVYYISENGLLNHSHVIESAMIVHKTGVPIEFKFLELYSKYLKKEINLSDDLVAQLLSENIFLKNIKAFDFNTGGFSEAQETLGTF